MKIPASIEILREEHNELSKKTEHVERISDVRLDPLNRSIEQIPVQEVDKVDRAEISIGNDQVQLSPEAKASMRSQEDLETAIGESIAEAFKVERIDLSEHDGLNYTPDALAQRIVDYSISVYGVYKDETQSSMADFEQRIHNAIDEGYQNATRTLENIHVPQQVLENREATIRKIDEGLQSFFVSGRHSLQNTKNQHLS